MNLEGRSGICFSRIALNPNADLSAKVSSVSASTPDKYASQPKTGQEYCMNNTDNPADSWKQTIIGLPLDSPLRPLSLEH